MEEFQELLSLGISEKTQKEMVSKKFLLISVARDLFDNREEIYSNALSALNMLELSLDTELPKFRYYDDYESVVFVVDIEKMTKLI